MQETSPISCISCRRKKIKCNKRKPCNQCKRREIICEFPSTFRNIEIKDRDDMPDTATNSIKEEFEMDTFQDDEKVIQALNKLKAERDDILHKNYQLTEHNKLLTKRLDEMNIQSNYFDKSEPFSEEQDNESKDTEMTDATSDMNKGKFKISGETSEFGKKFYGPQSSSFMIETLKSKNKSLNDSNQYPKNFLDRDNTKKFERSLKKKPLPKLQSSLNREENLSIIHKLVERFFQNYSSNYYKTFISKLNLVHFLNDYDSLDNNLWENDDDLLLLLMVLIFALIRSTPAEISELFDIPRHECNSFTYNLIHNNLFYNFEKLRHNLLDESMLTIQSYILCTEYFFIEQKYEECWSMMFHATSIAYSIGLHVTNKLKLKKLNEIDLNTGSDSTLDESEYDEMEDINKLKVWFSLRILSDKTCSVLGRPNPISTQVNSVILKYNQDFSNINLSQNTTSILLKIGLSECLRLSNMMLIENFMIDFTISELLNLNSKFEKEIYLLEMYLAEIIGSGHQSVETNLGGSTSGGSSTRQSGSVSGLESLSTNYDSTAQSNEEETDISNELSYDELNYLPIKIEEIDLMNDLIVFYINKAKLFEPFILKFDKVEEEAVLILSNLSNLIINFLKLISRLFTVFEDKLSKKRTFNLKIGKYFRVNFPFLNSFMYQGIVIIFTLLNYKTKEFIKLRYNDKFDNLRFLRMLKKELHELLNIDKNFDDRIWLVNIIYLTNKNLDLIDHIEKQVDQQLDDEINHLNNAFLNEPSFPQTGNVNGPPPILNNDLENLTNTSQVNLTNSTQNNEFLKFNLNDPFWITNPDNLPYYLTSPTEVFKPEGDDELGDFGSMNAMNDSEMSLPVDDKETHKKMKLGDYNYLPRK